MKNMGMQHLLIEQRGPAGLLKTWRIRQDQDLYTFGTSKHADLRSPETGLKGIQGVFEWRGSQWVYISLDLNQQTLADPVEIVLDEPRDLRMGTTSLKVVPFEPRSKLFDHEDLFSDSKQDGKAEKSPYHLFLVHHGDLLLETRLLRPGETFVSSFDPANLKVATQNSTNWVRIRSSDFEISQKQVFLTSAQAMAMISRDQFLDPSSKNIFLSVLVGAGLLGLLYLISPSSRDAREVAVNSVAPTIKEARVVLPKRKNPQPLPVPDKKTASAPAVNNQKMAEAPPNRLSAIKSLSTSRISQLIGKVSATAAKSNNVVISNSGVAAGTAATGSALSAVGKVDSSGKDWNSETKTGGVTVSTVGRSGGTTGMGKLGTGSTGTGGAELLEEESEITGGLDREVIANYIKSQLGQILYCYERQLSAQPELYGKVAVRFTIGPTGAVETQRVAETTLKSPPVESCMLQRVAKWKFPTPEGGTRVNVTYPFLFKSTN